MRLLMDGRYLERLGREEMVAMVAIVSLEYLKELLGKPAHLDLSRSPSRL